ncbi:MAG: MaoC family dehydratase [Pseudomonadota bacterium]|nr:MaoC family dehydratase [Pseudomonadota bacterium]
MNGLFLEDQKIGEAVVLGSTRFTRDAILRFAGAWDPQAFHLDDAAARASPFGALCASGWHTAAEWMRCYVAYYNRCRKELIERGAPAPEPGPSPGFANLRWPRPVYVDDEITYSSIAVATTILRSRPGWGMLHSDNRGINQSGDSVLSFDGKVMARLRG